MPFEEAHIEASTTILLVEDNPLDVKATLRAARGLGIADTFHVANDGEAALAYLRRDPLEGPRTGLVLLDLNLAGKDGQDILAEVKSDNRLRRIPVIVVTTSADDSDVFSAYDLGANAFATKPSSLEGWTELVSKVKDFWIDLARLPSS